MTPIYINIYSATLAFPLLDTLVLTVLSALMFALGWLLIDQNHEVGWRDIQMLIKAK
jgi:hypothetical protein